MPSNRKMEANRRREEARRRKRNRRKIILILVEGSSEVKALEMPLSAMLDEIDDSIDVKFQILCDRHRYTREERMGGDITSKEGVRPDTIENVIGKVFLAPFFRDQGLYPRDVKRVVHIVDTDGAFVSDDHVRQSPEGQRSIRYTPEAILTSNIRNIRDRNAQKRANLEKLASLASIKVDSKTVPYVTYFFSANLDHFLHGEANLESEQKVAAAREFADRCCMSPSLFYDKLLGDRQYCEVDYETSWKLIAQGTNSLQPHTNLGLLLADLGAL